MDESSDLESGTPEYVRPIPTLVFRSDDLHVSFYLDRDF